MATKNIIKFILLLETALILFLASALITTSLILKGEIVTVPNLRGKTLDEGRTLLSRNLLSLSFTGTEFDSEIEKGLIISQDPPAGSKIKANRMVKVIVSAGSEIVEIPDLLGKSLETAVQTLASVGLSRGTISQVHSRQYPAGRIIAQAPKPGGKVKRMTAINLLISQGEQELKYVMPDLIGQRVDQAVARLNELGFRVANVRSSYYPGLEPGIIIKQTPPHGFPVQKRNLISLEVSK